MFRSTNHIIIIEIIIKGPNGIIDFLFIFFWINKTIHNNPEMINERYRDKKSPLKPTHTPIKPANFASPNLK